MPQVGESVQEAVLAEWFKADGDGVRKDEALFLLETDKITLEVVAEADGVLRILVPAGTSVTVGQVVGRIEEGAGAAAGPEEAPGSAPEESSAPPKTPARPRPPEGMQAAGEAPPAQGAGAAPGETPPEEPLSPAVRRLVAQHGLEPGAIPATGPGGRLTKGDVLAHLGGAPADGAPSPTPPEPEPGPPPEPPGEKGGERREPLSPIRRRIAERLVEAARTTAMLTTFNEVDMARVLELRRRYKEAFREVHGVGLGLTSFFVKALAEAVGEFPRLNARIEGDEIVYPDGCHVGVAVGSDRGLVVPVVRHAERLTLAEIERAIAGFVEKIRANRLDLSDLEGGTISVTNGGVFGSLLSTPILNPPQSAILGLHKVEDRPVVVDGEIVVRPMMYVALTYDHRIVDGREAVQFLVRVKERVEDPARLLLGV
ncbi:2-oxoglutarate dehydrogenase complex dihydrolipoyllysine-residue succinyltransferase [Deferrisoma palaeochoriense]